MGILYIVSTPIGNLADISYRAVELLATADRVLAEDTRRTAILFKHYAIKTRLYSAHEHNEQARIQQILGWLDQGETVAMVSDAGTPLVSDPGARIVHTVLESGHQVIPIPGASSVLAALVGSGLDPEPFTYFGFLPRSGKGRTERLGQICGLAHTSVVFEAPSRVGRLLGDLKAVCGGERPAVVARELTKVHETFMRGTLDELHAYYEKDPPRGEVVVLVSGRVEAVDGEDLERRADQLAHERLSIGDSPRDIAKSIAKELGLARNRAYEIVLAAAASGETR
jgi:16S rRNA (cytidine1402-2'-O)-methyltransferase